MTRSPAALIALGCLGLVTAGVYAQTSVGVRDSGLGIRGVGDSSAVGRITGTTNPESQIPNHDRDYVGSAACQRCHEPEYDTWRNTLHVQMTKPVAEARIVGDFRPGTKLDDEGRGRAYAMDTRDGKYFVSISRKGRAAAESFEVSYTLGARRFQGYLSKLPDGRIYVLPVFWHTESKRWMDYSEITPIPKDSSHDLRQIWNVTCVNCHATNLVKNFDAERNTFASTWTEMGIGCEACHGPGRPHIDDPDHQKTFTMKKVPPRQIFDTCAYCHGNKNNVFFGFKAGDVYEDYALPFLISQPIPDNDPQGEFWPDGRPSRFNRPQALTLTGCFRTGQATCTSCHRIHGNQNNHSLKVAIDAPGGGHSRDSDTLCTQCHVTDSSGGAPAALPSESLSSSSEASALVRGGGGAPPPVERNGSGGSGWSGGASESRSARLQPSEASARAGGGAPPPVERSESGGSGRSGGDAAQPQERDLREAPPLAERESERQPSPIPDLVKHTHHAPESQGSRCINCHMSDVNWRLLTRRLDHTFQPPVPEMTARYGVPNACTTCHEEKSPEWAVATMDAWYGNAARRKAVVTMADTIYRAGAGDTAVLPDIAKLAVDRSHGSLIRASAAEFTGQLIAKTQSGGSRGSGGSGTGAPAAMPSESLKSSNEASASVRAGGGAPAQVEKSWPAITNALIGAASDSEAIVRVTAVRSLGLLREPRLVPILAAHLNDPARVVRVSAAQSLMNMGITQLDGVAGVVLARAQDEWSDSLRAFNDDASDHATLGWLEASRGRTAEAERELRTAVRLDPGNAQALVYLGVLAARAGRFEDALQRFKAAKAVAPGFPNIDRLIDEALKRR